MNELGETAFNHVHRGSLNKNNFCIWKNRPKHDQEAWAQLEKVIIDYYKQNENLRNN